MDPGLSSHAIAAGFAYGRVGVQGCTVVSYPWERPREIEFISHAQKFSKP